MYQASNDSAVASGQPSLMIGDNAAAAASSSVADSAYTVASEETATSRAARPGISAMHICQLKPRGAKNAAIAWPMRPA